MSVWIWSEYLAIFIVQCLSIALKGNSVQNLFIFITACASAVWRP